MNDKESLLHFDENFLYLLSYQATGNNLEVLADFVEANGLFILWKLPFTNDWFSFSDDQHRARLTLDRIFNLPNQNLRNFRNSYFLLEMIWDFASKNLENRDIIFLYSYVYNTELNVYFSGIVWKGNKIVLGVNAYLVSHIVSFLEFCRSLDLDFAWQVKEKHLQSRFETLVSYLF